jgi:hypothetical protein
MVAGGHLTPVPPKSIYSRVVSLRSLRIVVFLAELNSLKLWGADIGNAYLEAKAQEKVFVVAGPEFGDLAGHILIINKALYGLRSSGLRWHERFADTLRIWVLYLAKPTPTFGCAPVKGSTSTLPSMSTISLSQPMIPTALSNNSKAFISTSSRALDHWSIT